MPQPDGKAPPGPGIPPRQEPYRRALERAFEAVSLRSPADLALLGAEPAGAPGRYAVRMLDRAVELDLGARTILAGGEPLIDTARILLLHYLSAAATGGPAKLVSFRGIPSAAGYHGPYSGRVLGRLTRKFGAKGEGFEAACRAAGGVREPAGDIGFRFDLLPRVAVRVLYFLGDSELGPSDDMLYGDDVTDYLSVEDVVVGSELLAMRLTGKSWGGRKS